MSSPHWNQSELLLMRALAVQLRVLSFEQIKRGWFPNISEDIIRESISALKAAGLLQENICEIQNPIELDRPLLIWNPGDKEPNVDRLARISGLLESRWDREFTACRLFSVTPLGANQFGSRGGKLSREVELTHDFHLSEVYLKRLQSEPSRIAERWIGEMAVEKLGFQIKRMKDPDAYVLDDDGKALQVIEFAGKYSVSHLQDLHRHCAGDGFRKATEHGIAELTVYRPEGTGYEIW